MATSKLYRPCDLCGQVDTHPRHSFAGVIDDVWPVLEEAGKVVQESLERLVAAGEITMAQAFDIAGAHRDTTSTDRHIDCCAAAGCPLSGTPDGCDARVRVWNGRTGAGMVKAAEKVRADHADHYAALERPHPDEKVS